jgi:formylglycine-generating enzyme required for sulfatase activity
MKTNPGNFKGGDRPVESADWNEAKAFCEKAKMRLPTEAEWEYAARAGDHNAHYGRLEDIAWYDANSGGGTHPVAQKAPNAWGLYDMRGNVWEWVNDWFGPYSASLAIDPRGPLDGEYRGVRGGSWNDIRMYVRVSVRGRFVPAYRDSAFGFRCAGELP